MKTKHTPGPWETCHFGEKITSTYYTKGGTEKVSYEDRTHTRTIR